MADYLTYETEYSLAGTSLTFGAIAYGCWRYAGTDVAAATSKIETALECGFTLIDTADIYGTTWPDGFGEAEALLGDVLAANAGLRNQMVLATKGGIVPGLPYNSAADYLIKACEDSLSRLKTDVIDLYQIHRPDLLTPFEEVAGALNKLLSAGKIRSAGVSNFTVSQTNALQRFMDRPLVSHQPEFSCLETTPMTDGVLDQAQENRMVAFAWSPLAGGQLVTGKAAGAAVEKVDRILPVLDRIAAENGCDRSAVALAWLLAHPAKVVPIVGTQTLERIRKSADALTVKMTRRDWYDILEASLGAPMP